MSKRTLKIIGLNPGTRYMGIAVFYGSELRDWQVKNMEGRWSVDKMTKAITVLASLIDSYEANVIAIKKLHPSRVSTNLTRLVSRIKSLSEKNGLKIYEYSIDEIKEYLQPEIRTKKRDFAEIMAAEYPVLFHELNKEQTNLNPYYIRMFEAVAIGSLCLHRLDRHKLS